MLLPRFNRCKAKAAKLSPVRQHQLLGLGLGVVDIGIDLEALHHVLDQHILPFTSVKASMDPDLFDNLCIIDTPDYNPGTTGGAAASNHSTAASFGQSGIGIGLSHRA